MKYLLTLLLLAVPAFAAPKLASPRPSVPALFAVTGTGHDVALSCTGSTGATSYNFKRATTAGGPYTTVGSSATCAFDDTSSALTDGAVFFYVATAVKTVGTVAAESGVSNEVQATIPVVAPAPPTGLTVTPH